MVKCSIQLPDGQIFGPCTAQGPSAAREVHLVVPLAAGFSASAAAPPGPRWEPLGIGPRASNSGPVPGRPYSSSTPHSAVRHFCPMVRICGTVRPNQLMLSVSGTARHSRWARE